MKIKTYQYKKGDINFLVKFYKFYDNILVSRSADRCIDIFTDNFINNYKTEDLCIKYNVNRTRIRQILQKAVRRINKFKKLIDDTVQEGKMCCVLKEGETVIETDEQKTCCKAHETD